MADEPVPVAQLATALNVTPREVESALVELAEAGNTAGRGLRLQRAKDRVQLTTAPAAADHVERFLGLESIQRLSHPALETLAIVAYQQPVTRPHIEAVRGVNCDGVMKSLLSKGLIEESGRTEGPGRPILYCTTPAFLQHFGLSSLADLPQLNLDAKGESAPPLGGDAEDSASAGSPIDASEPEPPAAPAPEESHAP